MLYMEVTTRALEFLALTFVFAVGVLVASLAILNVSAPPFSL